MTSKEAPSANAAGGGRLPAIDRKLRDEIGARLRREYGDLTQAPLPSQIAYLLALLARAAAEPKPDK